MIKNGISINAILKFPAFRANAIIKTMEMALSIFPIKNVLGMSNSTPIAKARNAKNGMSGSLIPKPAIIFNDSGFFL